MENMDTSRKSKPAGGGTRFKAAPLERSSYKETGTKPDPYVVRAMARAQNKLKNKMVHINGGHLN